jgi:hypothetical protein
MAANRHTAIPAKTATAREGRKEKWSTKWSSMYCQRSKLAVKNGLQRIVSPPAA